MYGGGGGRGQPPPMSAEERKRKYEALETTEIRRNPDGSVELVAAAPSKSPGGGGSGAQMSVAEAKAFLERAGVKSKKHKKEKKSKKEKKGKKEKKKRKEKKAKKAKKDKKDKESSSSSSSDSDSDSDGGEGGGGGGGGGGRPRQWKSGDLQKGSGKKWDKDKKDKGEWGKPPGPEVQVEPIAEDDYYLKNHEFAAWLKHARGTFFTDLLAEDARRLFKEFVVEWNARRLAAKLYEGITVAGRR